MSTEVGTVVDDLRRRPYLGSCHCGFTKYILWLTLPPKLPYESPKEGEQPCQMIRKCNCNTCQKMGFFHIRPAFAPADFVLLSPLNPEQSLGRYSTFHPASVWYFCKTCGIRCVMVDGQGEVTERNLAEDGVDLKRAGIEGDGTAVKVWTVKEEGWVEEKTGWLRVNAQTLDANQEGLDLREWKEKQWIQYVNWLDEIPGEQYDRPYHCGIY